jgi:hypothetical protein
VSDGQSARLSERRGVRRVAWLSSIAGLVAVVHAGCGTEFTACEGAECQASSGGTGGSGGLGGTGGAEAWSDAMRQRGNATRCHCADVR